MKIVGSARGVLTMLFFLTDYRFGEGIMLTMLIHMLFLTDRFNKWYRYTYC